MSNNDIKIYKASAGAGKTFTLAHYYVDRLFEAFDSDKEAYRHILAVTFTNKATDEMKDRILHLLYEYSQGRSEIKGEEVTGQIKEKAKNVLLSILHDYSGFYVTTIDKFFQMVFKTFSRELGRNPSYRVELDEAEVSARAVDDLLESLDDEGNPRKEAVYGVMRDFAELLLKYDKNVNYESQLYRFASLFGSEQFKVAARACDLSTMATDREQILENIAKAEGEFTEAVVKKAAAIDEILSRHDLAYDVFSHNTNWIGKIPLYKEGVFCGYPTATFAKMLSGEVELWLPKGNRTAANLAKLKAAVADGLGTLLEDFLAIFGIGCGGVIEFDNLWRRSNTAKLIRKNLDIMSIFSDLYDSLSDYLKQHNVMLLSETCHALNRMVAGSDTPFIYERIGTRFNHFLLDEFQDFSTMQWENFRPLIEQSHDSGYGNLIVGDVKQSIYRWRGSDWKTLDSRIGEELNEKNISYPPIKENYRSDEVIVGFNNGFFEYLTFQDKEEAWLDEADAQIRRMYAGGSQNPTRSGNGRVKVTFSPNGTPREQLALALVDDVRELEERGYPAGSIVVLVRKREEGAIVAKTLIDAGIEVITDEALVVGASKSVVKIVSVLKHLAGRCSSTDNILLEKMGVDVGKIDAGGNSLYEMAESIARAMQDEIQEGELPYFAAFMDLVLEYMSNQGSDLVGFVKWWDDSGCGQPVLPPKDNCAVKIMTIHKAKGLGSEAVLIPFFNEPFAPRASFGNIVWCRDKFGFGAQLIPVKYNSEMESTAFVDEYKAERLYIKSDAINTAYVALTRAKNEMIVHCCLPKENRDGYQQASVSDVLYRYLEEREGRKDSYEFGSPTTFAGRKTEDKSVETVVISQYDSIPMEGGDSGSPRLSLVCRGARFFENQEKRIRGIVLHDILSKIHTEADVAGAVEDAVREGDLPLADRDETKAMIDGMLDFAKDYGWFSPEAEVLEEVAIIDPEGRIYRPDRVVVRDGQAVVVDYKFGAKNSRYAGQVREYMELLRQMDYTSVEGYLWYALNNEIIAVK